MSTVQCQYLHVHMDLLQFHRHMNCYTYSNSNQMRSTYKNVQRNAAFINSPSNHDAKTGTLA